MKEYSFDTLAPLLAFIEDNKKYFLNATLKNVYTDLGDSNVPFHSHSTDESIMFLMDDIYLIVDYYIPSDITIKIAILDEVKKDKRLSHLLTCDADDEPTGFMDRPQKSDLQNHKIVSFGVEQFSNSFIINPVDDSERPDGGDYFGTVFVELDNGVQICICGADAYSDGYMKVWAR